MQDKSPARTIIAYPAGLDNLKDFAEAVSRHAAEQMPVVYGAGLSCLAGFLCGLDSLFLRLL